MNIQVFFNIRCWEPCGLVADYYMNAFPRGLQMRQKPTGTDSLGKNQWTLGTVQNTVETVRPARSSYND